MGSEKGLPGSHIWEHFPILKIICLSCKGLISIFSNTKKYLSPNYLSCDETVLESWGQGSKLQNICAFMHLYYTFNILNHHHGTLFTLCFHHHRCHHCYHQSIYFVLPGMVPTDFGLLSSASNGLPSLSSRSSQLSLLIIIIMIWLYDEIKYCI